MSRTDSLPRRRPSRVVVDCLGEAARAADRAPTSQLRATIKPIAVLSPSRAPLDGIFEPGGEATIHTTSTGVAQ